MTVSINGTNGLVFQDGTSQPNAAFTGFRNKLINGNFDIWQRATTSGSAGLSASDRWQMTISGTGTMSYQHARSTDVPTVASAYSGDFSVTSGSYTLTEFAARQFIEKQTMAEFVGKTVTLSFWYKSNKTGTHGARIAVQNGAGTNLDNNGSFTVNAANTWEFKQIQFNSFVGISDWSMASGTASGGFVDIGFKVGNAGPGQSTVVSGDYFRISRVQLELGSGASLFEYRPPMVELELCRRYLRVFGTSQDIYSYLGGIAYYESANALQLPIQITGMRTQAVSVSIGGTIQAEAIGGTLTATGVGLRGTDFVRFQMAPTSSGTTGQATAVRSANDWNGRIIVSAEI